MMYLQYVDWNMTNLNKANPIGDMLELEGRNTGSKVFPKDVVNLQLSSDNRLIRRNPADSTLGQRETKIIANNLNTLCSMYNKLPSVHARCKEMRIEINNPSFISCGRGELVSGNKGVDFDIFFSLIEGYFVFINTKDNSESDELTGTPRIEDAISFIKNFVYRVLGVSFNGTKIESGVVAILNDFVVDKTGVFMKPTSLVLEGPQNSCKDFLKSLKQYNLFSSYDEDFVNDALIVKLSLGEKGFPILLKLCYKFGSRLNVNTTNSRENIYLREINNYYNKKACAIRASGILKIV